MQISIYEITVPVFIRSMSNLLKLMAKAEQHAKHKKFDLPVFLSGRLAPDMYNFNQQIQYVYFLAFDAVSGLTGKKAPLFKYDEKTMDDLKKSLKRAIAFLKTVKQKDFVGSDKKKVPLFFAPKKLIPAKKYLATLALPDFFFHYTTAYGILRHLGVDIGKADFIGPI